MAITDPKTVLILGAGVSAPFGLPVGAGLIDDIAKSLSSQLERFSKKYMDFSSLLPLNSFDGSKIFLEFAYLQTLLWKIGALDPDCKWLLNPHDWQKKLRHELQNMSELQKLLQNQTSDSIDDFIVMNPAYSEHVKLCIAAEFIKALYGMDDRSIYDMQLKDIDKRYLPSQSNSTSPNSGERNWIHRLINLIRLGISEGRVSEENKLQIITFNYDTILEYVLEQQFSNTENGKYLYPDYRKFVEIIHVHGQCGELSKNLNVPSKSCWEWSKGIKVIREDEDNLSTDIINARVRAKNLVGGASEIYCCGFAFARANTDLLGLKEGPLYSQMRSIHYCNYTGDIGLSNAANRFVYDSGDGTSFSKVIPQNGIGVSDWIGIGTLGELP